jgi:hypothetical protein
VALFFASDASAWSPGRSTTSTAANCSAAPTDGGVGSGFFAPLLRRNLGRFVFAVVTEGFGTKLSGLTIAKASALS